MLVLERYLRAVLILLMLRTIIVHRFRILSRMLAILINHLVEILLLLLIWTISMNILPRAKIWRLQIFSVFI